MTIDERFKRCIGVCEGHYEGEKQLWTCHLQVQNWLRQKPPLQLSFLHPDCWFLKIWKSISHFIGWPIICSKIMPREILLPILAINGLYFQLMYSKNNKQWSQWKTIIEHAYFRMKSYINRPRPQTEKGKDFFFFLTWQKGVNRGWEVLFPTIKTVFLDCWKAPISSSHIIPFLWKIIILLLKMTHTCCT